MMRRFTKSIIAFFLFTISSFIATGQGIITFEFYVDQNCDGIKQAGEPFTTAPDIPSLFDVTNFVPVVIVPTLAGNTYSYASLPDGDYELTWVNPSSGPWILSSPAGGTTNITIAGANPTVVRAAYYQQSTLTHFAWEDTNGNGIQDGGENGIDGLTLTLTGSNFCSAAVNLVAAPLGGGLYEFVDVDPSNAAGYTINFSLPGGFERSDANEGGNDNIDSDPDPGTGNVTGIVVLNDANTANNEIDNVDAGYFEFSTISDFVWEDINGNGIQDGEPGIDGVTVNLTGTDGAGNAVSLSDVTAGGGFYEFTMVPPGINYTIDFVLPVPTASGSWFFTAQNQGGDDDLDSDANPANGEVNGIVIESGDAPVTNIDAGMYIGGSIGNFVWEDLNGDGDQDGGEPGFAGITVAISGNTGAGVALVRPNIVTPGSGAYLFDNLPPGMYTITCTGLPANHFWTDPDLGGDDNLDSDVDKVTGAAPIQTIVSDQDVLDIDAGLFEAVTISNLVWEDLNGNGIQDGGEPGLDGVSVNIETSVGGAVTKANGVPAATVISGPAGAYIFDILKPGSYVVTFENFPTYFRTLKDVGVDAADSDADILTGETGIYTLISGDVNNTVDCGYFEGCKIGDFTWEDTNGNGLQDGGEPALGGVTMTLTDGIGAAVTDALNVAVAPIVSGGAGDYEFIDLRPGTYIVTFAAPGGYFPTRLNAAGGATDATDVANDSDCNQAMTNRSHTITLTSGEDEEDIDAGFYEPVTLGDFVWHDADADGIQDGGEPGLELIGVTLSNADMSPLTDVNNMPVAIQITNAAGMYSFTDLRPGLYKLTLTAPGWLYSVPDVGGDATDNDFAMGMTIANVQINSGGMVDFIDAGLYKNINLCGTVWIEQDDDGLQEPPVEVGALGVEVTLTGTAGDGMAIMLTDVTDAMGEYCFAVKPGDYIIAVTPANFGSGNPLNGVISCTPTADPNNDVDLDDNGDGPGSGPVQTSPVLLRCGEEPENMGINNNTVDFCFRFDCGGISTVFTESCETVVDTFCNLSILNAGCGTMFPGPLVEPAPNPLCNGGGAPHNMSWFAFIAGTGNYAIEIVPMGCTAGGGGQLGVQTGIYTDCSFSTSVFCMNACSTAPISVPSTNLIPGNTYYWWFDGCSGSVCSYDINVTGTFVEYVIPEPTEIVCASGTCSPICPNNRVTLQVNEGYANATLKFVWRVTDPMGNITTVNTLTNQLPDYLLDKVGVWKFEIVSISNKCNSSSVIKELLITVRNPADEDFGTVSLCEDFIMGWVGPSEDASGNPDPNGDGFGGWQISPFVFTAGPPPGAMNMATYTGTGSGQEGCIYKQTVRLIKKLNSPTVRKNYVLCPDEIPYIISADFPFPIPGNLEELEVVLPMAAANGCDSTVIINSVVLESTNGQVVNLGCANGKTSFLLQDEILPSAPNIGVITVTYRVRRSNGVLVNDGNPDSNPKTILLSIPDDYIWEIVMTLNGKTCITEVPFSFVPTTVLATPTPFNWNTNFCSSTTTSTFEAQSTESNPSWVWTAPPGVTVTGATTNKITVNWNNVLGGEICVSIKDNCGESVPFCDTVVITKVPTARFNLTDEICIDSLARANYSIVPKIPGVTYNWTLDGGSIISTPKTNGIDTLDIKWPTSGEKFVTLIVVNNGPNGLKCPSVPFRDSVTVVPKQAAPVIDCISDATSITYSWPPFSGQIGNPTVNIIAGPTGVLGTNTYSITGQVPFVTSDIEVIFNNNHACGVVRSVGSCITSNCTKEVAKFEPIPDVCLTATSPTISLKPFVTGLTTSNGAFTFTSPTTPGAITDATNGIFDPKIAGVGTHQLRVVYIDVLGCQTDAKFSSITVNETPTATFVVDDPICQDSSATVRYTGNITSGGSFTWDFGPNTTQVGGNAGPFEVAWSTLGLKTITLSISKDGCPSPVGTQSLTLESRIDSVKITCVESPTSITFDWNDISNISGYVVTLDNNVITTPPSTLLALTSLPTDKSYTIKVEAISNTACPGKSATLTCKTDGCPPLTTKFSIKDTTLCNLPNAAVIPINVTLTGGLQSVDQKITWSGPGVTQNPTNDKQGFFDPKIAGIGVHTIKMVLVDGTCTKEATMKITIIAQPKSTFTGVNKICITDPYQLTFSGTTGLPFNWTKPNGVIITAVPGQPTKFDVKFPNPGTFKIDLVVGNPSCLSEVSTLTVVVDPELESVNLTCTQTTTSITFSWSDIECATQYNVKLDGTNRGNQSVLTFAVNGLTVGDQRTLIVTPISTCACPPMADTLTCEAKQCPTITVTASTPTTSFCLGSVTTPIQLASNVAGSSGTGSGSWSGPNASTIGLITVVGLTPGKYDYEYTFTEESCTYKAQTSITIHELPQLSIALVQPDCYQNNVGTFTPTVVGSGTFTYKLDNVTVTSPFASQSAGSYTLLVTDQNQCTDQESFTIIAATTPSIALVGTATNILAGQPVTINSSITGLVGTIDSIVWKDNKGNTVCSGSAAECNQITVTPEESIKYCATVYFNSGCTIENCVDVIVKKIVVITVPNVISIGSGSNSSFFVQNYEAVKIVKSMQIFDRWGNLMFTKKDVAPGDPSQGWDGRLNGKEVVPGVYVYKIDLELLDGNVELFKGDLTVLQSKQ